MDTLIPAQEAALRLAVSYWTLLRWVRAGHIANVKLGRRRLFVEEDLQKFIRQARLGSSGNLAGQGQGDKGGEQRLG